MRDADEIERALCLVVGAVAAAQRRGLGAPALVATAGALRWVLGRDGGAVANLLRRLEAVAEAERLVGLMDDLERVDPLSN